MSTPFKCINCQQPFEEHCILHVVPCCPGKCLSREQIKERINESIRRIQEHDDKAVAKAWSIDQCKLGRCPLYRGECLHTGRCMATEHKLEGTGWDHPVFMTQHGNTFIDLKPYAGTSNPEHLAAMNKTNERAYEIDNGPTHIIRHDKGHDTLRLVSWLARPRAQVSLRARASKGASSCPSLSNNNQPSQLQALSRLQVLAITSLLGLVGAMWLVLWLAGMALTSTGIMISVVLLIIAAVGTLMITRTRRRVTE